MTPLEQAAVELNKAAKDHERAMLVRDLARTKANEYADKVTAAQNAMFAAREKLLDLAHSFIPNE